MKIAASIVLFYPEKEALLKNILSYSNEVEKIYAIDNTPTPSAEIVLALQSSEKIEYIANNDNLGIAKALNQACNKAIEDGFDWIVTFDQDSSCLPNTIQTLVNIAKENNKVGSVSPVYIPSLAFLEESKNWFGQKQTTEAECAITSCCLTNLEAYKRAGGFEDDFFIDLVDIDFSFKLRELGYKVLITPNAMMVHSLGDSKFFKLWAEKKIWYSNHSPIRRYYITRNRLYFIERYKNKHPNFCKKEIKNMAKETVKILLFENQKWQKIKAMYFAFKDYSNKVKGKTNHRF